MGKESVDFNKPVKCPDCKVWWRGETHKCKPVQLEFDYEYEKKSRKPSGKDPVNIYQVCKFCGYRVTSYPHSCSGTKVKHVTRKDWHEKYDPPYWNA